MRREVRTEVTAKVKSFATCPWQSPYRPPPLDPTFNFREYFLSENWKGSTVDLELEFLTSQPILAQDKEGADHMEGVVYCSSQTCI